jgi:protocatechuate 3,4-dioxygenase beta subunit
MGKLLFLLVICLYNSIAFAKYDKFYPNGLNSCKVTKSMINDYEPSQFQITNNLLRLAGGQASYCGKKIVITGKVLDENCVPVSDAKVYLWQVGCDGKYPFTPLRQRIDKNMLNLKSKSTFTGSGTATTNNKGEFHFITIFPKPAGREIPHVNVRVEHRDLGKLQTKLYLSNANELGSYDLIDPNLYNLDCEVDIYNFEIVLPGETLRRY